jgi:hypothetical protein
MIGAGQTVAAAQQFNALNTTICNSDQFLRVDFAEIRR